MNKIKYLITLVSLGLIVAFGIHQTQAQADKGSTLKYDAKKDTLYTPKLETIQDLLTLTGSIDSDQVANLRFQSSGKLVWVGVKVGDHVRRGQAIASLDRVELQKNLATQFNNYRTQLSQFNDIQDTYKSAKDNLLVTDTIQRILDRTQYSLDNSVINYEIKDMAIKESVLISPIDGIVVAVDQPIPGTNVTPATANFIIINPNSLFFKSEIDQQAVTLVKVGQPVTLKLDSFPDFTNNSKINYIAFTPVSGQSSTVYEIRFDLPIDNADLTYRLGMDGNVELILNQSENALTIPIDAVNDDNGQNYVYVKSDNQLVRRDVTIGIETDTTSEVKQGLSQNDQVAVIKK